MLFNSFQFGIYFVVVTTLYFILPHRFRWAMLLGASCLFYMTFVPIYIFILLATIVVDYFAAIQIAKTEGAVKKSYLVFSILSTCAILFVFKYFNFFTDNVYRFYAMLGIPCNWPHLGWALPIGLSFHTFQSLSYVVEVYRGKQVPERHFGIYSLYVMFYPQLVAGPIERPQNLLHQFYEKHTFDYDNFVIGMRHILKGLFKKVVVADRAALIADKVFNNMDFQSPVSVLLGVYMFAVQIYCDFSGYSDIAIGCARVMGFKLMTNFERPYVSRSLAEFWRRWHISLSTWFKDYVYFPLGGSQVPSRVLWVRNILIVFLISGLWHGASWTYVVWGAFHGSVLAAAHLTQTYRDRFWATALPGKAQSFRKFIQWAVTFHLVCFGWIFFRANSLSDALQALKILAYGAWRWEDIFVVSNYQMLYAAIAVALLIMIENSRRFEFHPEKIQLRPVVYRWSAYLGLTLWMLLAGVFDGGQFIYFQF